LIPFVEAKLRTRKSFRERKSTIEKKIERDSSFGRVEKRKCKVPRMIREALDREERRKKRDSPFDKKLLRREDRMKVVYL
jgi:hypothetical protein